ncbi:MAG: DNA-binding transcriptional regulator YiaG [Sulfurimonas sp.]|jgi:DNA-binding transcriptional regulator YiaG
MIKLLLLSLLSTLLIAQNPKVYSALGDVIYNNVQNIEKLKNINFFSEFEEKIDSYVKDVYKAKDIGYAIQSGNEKVDKKQYLQTIRELSKINDFFYRLIIKSYKFSIIDQNNLFFSKIINSGMIDTKKNKDEILEYYFAHSYDMNSSGVIQKYLDEDEKLKQKQTVSKKQTLSKKQIQDAKIKRIREKDKAKQESIQKTLEDELIKKKRDIRKEQIDELTKPN